MRPICQCGKLIFQRKHQSYTQCATCRMAEEKIFRKIAKNKEIDRDILIRKVMNEYVKLVIEKEKYEKENEGYFSWLYRHAYALRVEGESH